MITILILQRKAVDLREAKQVTHVHTAEKHQSFYPEGQRILCHTKAKERDEVSYPALVFC